MKTIQPVTNKKLILIEGPQCSGKTFLINEFKKAHYFIHTMFYKFSFAEVTQDLLVLNDRAKFGLSIGRDVSIINFLKQSHYQSLIVDRGFLSSIVWGLLDSRISEEEAKNYTKFINTLLEDIDCYLIMIFKSYDTVPFELERNRGDSYDNKYSQVSQADLYWEWSKAFEFKYTTYFLNRFDKNSVERFNNLLIWSDK